MLRYGASIAVALAVLPAGGHAQQMTAAEARAFVVGKTYSYVCFEGTRGMGRIHDNGSVAGTIQFRGNGATRYAMLPANTLRVVGNRVCAQVKGVPFEPCFNLVRTSASSFRGSVNGLGFAYCDFVRRDQPMVAAAEPHRRSVFRAAEAAPVTAVESKDLPPVETAVAPAESVSRETVSKDAADAPLELRSSKD